MAWQDVKLAIEGLPDNDVKRAWQALVKWGEGRAVFPDCELLRRGGIPDGEIVRMIAVEEEHDPPPLKPEEEAWLREVDLLTQGKEE